MNQVTIAQVEQILSQVMAGLIADAIWLKSYQQELSFSQVYGVVYHSRGLSKRVVAERASRIPAGTEGAAVYILMCLPERRLAIIKAYVAAGGDEAAIFVVARLRARTPRIVRQVIASATAAELASPTPQ